MALTTSRRGVGSQLPTSAVLEATRLTARNLLVWQEHWQSYCPGLTRRVEDVKRNRRVHRTAGDHSATSIRMGILQRGLGALGVGTLYLHGYHPSVPRSCSLQRPSSSRIQVPIRRSRYAWHRHLHREGSRLYRTRQRATCTRLPLPL